MKVSCPNCEQVLKAPDKWAGRKVKCPSCKHAITIPGATPAYEDLNLDLGSLEAIETEGEALVFDRKGKPLTLKQAQAEAGSNQPVQTTVDPRIRTCPKCGQKVRCDDLYTDILCRHCGGPIDGRELKESEKGRYSSDMAGRMKTSTSFYTGFGGAAVYPLPGMASILLGMGVALGTIAVPLLGVLAFTSSASLNEINEDKGASAWVGLFLTVMFVVEGIYFGSVGYYILIDTIRTTTSGSEQPPNLTWNIVNLGAALAGYVALVAFYAIAIFALFGGVPTEESLADPLKLFLLALLTFSVPMNMIGLASSHAMDGLNPVRVFRSIGRVFGHYIFLFLIVLLYLGIFVGLTWLVMGWAGPAIAESAQKGIGAGFLKMLGGVGAWGILVGLGFYFAYSIGRVLGLFSRTYREQIDFET